MATISYRPIVDDIIADNGEDPDLPWKFVKIVEYTTPEGKTAWGCVLDVEVSQGIGDRYDHENDSVRNPRTIWTRKEPQK